jgi:hypothetical protein
MENKTEDKDRNALWTTILVFNFVVQNNRFKSRYYRNRVDCSLHSAKICNGNSFLTLIYVLSVNFPQGHQGCQSVI